MLTIKKNNGFTVVEMITVIGIIAIVTAIAIPNLYSFSAGMRLRSATRDMYSNMKKARINAIRQSTTMTINIMTDGKGSYILNNGTIVNIASAYPGVALAGQTFLYKNQAAAVFFSDGTSNGGTVTFKGATGQQATVTVLASGKITSS